MAPADEVVERHFDRAYAGRTGESYSFEPGGLNRRDRRLADALRDYGLQGRSYLDIGPGTGRWLTFARQEGAATVQAVDISSTILDQVAPLVDQGHKVDLEVTPLPLADDSLDVVTAFEVIEHLRTPDLFVGEVLRVLRPGGLLLLTTPNLTSLMSRLRFLFGLMPRALSIDPTHYRCYRQRDLAALFARFGQAAEFLPSSISLDPWCRKNRWAVPSCRWLSTFDDALACRVLVRKEGGSDEQ